MSDLFATVQLTQRLLARTYFPAAAAAVATADDPIASGGSFTVAVQDGVEAGQTVPHVHVHVIPRLRGGEEGLERPDDLYVKMAGEEGNVGGALWDEWNRRRGRPEPGGGMPRIEDEERAARTKGQMNEEAEGYKKTLGEMGVEWKTGDGG